MLSLFATHNVSEIGQDEAGIYRVTSHVLDSLL
jgi:hypothetical protein